MEVYFLDVGQGDASFVRTSKGQTILIDGGGVLFGGQQETMGERVVIPFLLDQRVFTLDYVISTHIDADHSSGLKDVLETIDVKTVLIPAHFEEGAYDDFFELAERKEIKIQKVYTGHRLKMAGDTQIDFYNPPVQDRFAGDSNENSVVCKLTYKKSNILFTGDISSEVEKAICNDQRSIQAQVLKVAHHGSGYSSDIQFLEYIQSQVAVISVGKNLYGHPQTAVLQRLQETGNTIYRTDRHGAVHLTSNGESIER
jgi:competence protein ComEC